MRVRGLGILLGAAVLVGCSEAPSAVSDPLFLIGDAASQPITLDKSGGGLPVLVAPITINKGIVEVAIEDQFLLRVSGTLTLPDGSQVANVDPKDGGVTGAKDTGVRQGSDVPLDATYPLDQAQWDAIKDLDEVVVTLQIELILTTASGERVLDTVEKAGGVDPKDNG